MEVNSDAVKNNYCIGTWNVQSMNQGKLEMVKQEMARMNINILGISELKWTGMGGFDSDDHYIYYCGQESLRKLESPSQSTKEFEMQFLGAMSKMTVISVDFQGELFNITVIQVYAPSSNAEEDEVERFYEPTRPSRTNTQNRCPFHYR